MNIRCFSFENLPKVALKEHGSFTNSAIIGVSDNFSVIISSDCSENWTSLRDFKAFDPLTSTLTEFTNYSVQKWQLWKSE
jgi:hypothetical protein